MIKIKSYLKVADNTGAKKVMCIGILGQNKKKAKIGDIIVAVVKEAIPNMSIKKSNIVKSILIRTKDNIKRIDGTYLRFNENAVILINNQKNPIGTRIFGPIAKEIRYKNLPKIISLAKYII